TDKDSEIVVGTLANDGTITWTTNRVTCSLSFQSLAMMPGDNARVYGACRGDGVYVILPDAPLKVPDRIGAAFHAEGNLVATLRPTVINGSSVVQQLLFATGHTTSAFPTTYNFVRSLELSHANTPVDITLPAPGQDSTEVA